MSVASQIWSRLRAVIFRSSLEREMEREWQFHVESRAADLVDAGLSQEQAERQARAEFGATPKWKEESREARGTAWLDDLHRDVLHACRQLRRMPGFALTAITTFALGIGATTGIVSVAYAVLIRPLPFANAERLVQIVDEIRADDRGSARRTPTALDLDEFEHLRSRSRALKRMGIYVGANLTMTGRGDPVRLVATRMSADFPAMLGDRPILGRAFDAADVSAGNTAVVVLSFGTWQRHFGGAPNVLGRNLTLDGQPRTVIGVMPATFAFPDRLTDVWLPFGYEAKAGVSRRFYTYGEIADDVPLHAAVIEVSGLLQEMKGFAPVEDYLATGEPLPFGLVGLKDDLVASVRPALLLLAAAAGAVLLLACINVATLLLARGAARQREIGIRVAMGASPGRLIRQFLAESLLVSVAGGLAGFWLSAGGVTLLRAWGTGLTRRDLGPAASIPRLAEVQLDSSLVGVAVGLALASGVLAGMWPALRHAVPDRFSVLKGASAHDRSGSGATRRLPALNILVIAQIAVAITLLVGGALLMRSFVNFGRVDLGFEPANMLTFQVSFPTGRYDRDALAAFSHDVVMSLRDIPGVETSAYTHFLPTVRAAAGGRMTRSPQPPAGPREPGAPPSPEDPTHIWLHHDFLRAFRMTVVEGRAFNADDRAGRPNVVVVNQTLARSGLLGVRPVGQFVYFGTEEPWEVIGVIKDFTRFSLGAPAGPVVLFDERQRPALPGAGGMSPYIVVRTERRVADILPDLRSAISRVDRDAAVVDVATMDDIIGHAVSRPRLYAALMTAFATSALFIALAGLVGLVSYGVARRTREVGIRLTLGATRSGVLRLFLAGCVRLVVPGIVIGLVMAAGLSRFLEGLLFGVSPLEPEAFAFPGLLVLTVSLLAAVAPARRAANVDPVLTLRAE